MLWLSWGSTLTQGVHCLSLEITAGTCTHTHTRCTYVQYVRPNTTRWVEAWSSPITVRAPKALIYMCRHITYFCYDGLHSGFKHKEDNKAPSTIIINNSCLWSNIYFLGLPVVITPRVFLV